jgi:hypothetical protein
MNIFVLDHAPQQAAMWHCDAHVIKMILETAQMLSTINRMAGKTEGIYKATHQNHVCTVWARASTENYRWLHQLGMSLCLEYTERYSKTHASKRVIDLLSKPPMIVPEGDLTTFVMAMPDQYKKSNPILAYRDYYTAEKSKGKLGTWKQNKPDWWVRNYEHR